MGSVHFESTLSFLFKSCFKVSSRSKINPCVIFVNASFSSPLCIINYKSNKLQNFTAHFSSKRHFIACPKNSRGLRSSGCPRADEAVTTMLKPQHLVHLPTTASKEENIVSDVKEKKFNKSLDDLDGPPGWPIIGNFLLYLRKENKGKMHEVQASLHRKYGKMFREKWGPKWQVHVSDPDLIEEIYRHEGRYPFRPSLQPWLLYRQIKNLPHGITTAQGMEWQHYRTEFGKRLFCPSATKSLIEPLSNVADDFVTKVERVLADCNQNFDDNYNKEIYFAKQLPNISYLWSLEAAGSFLFETRLGCLAPSIPTRTQKFLDSLQEMMTSSLYLIVGEKFHQRLNTRFWRKHEKSWDNIFNFGKTLIDEKLLSLESSEEVTGPYLSHLLKNKNLTMNQIYTNITELLMAGSDTTANTFCFVLYMLANNPDKQNLLRQEIQSIMSMSSFAASQSPSLTVSSSTKSKKITSNHLENMKYLKCVIKETMRLYPVVTMNCRVLNQDIQLDGYTIPKETLFVMNHYAASIDEDNFHDPNKFLPERWLREGDVSQQQHKVQQQTDIKKHPFASLPFGYGSRSCLGKHVGKMELMVTLIKVLDKFDVKPLVEQQDLKPVLRTLLTPGQLVPVRLCRRY